MTRTQKFFAAIVTIILIGAADSAQAAPRKKGPGCRIPPCEGYRKPLNEPKVAPLPKPKTVQDLGEDLRQKAQQTIPPTPGSTYLFSLMLLAMGASGGYLVWGRRPAPSTVDDPDPFIQEEAVIVETDPRLMGLSGSMLIIHPPSSEEGEIDKVPAFKRREPDNQPLNGSSGMKKSEAVVPAESAKDQDGTMLKLVHSADRPVTASTQASSFNPAPGELHPSVIEIVKNIGGVKDDAEVVILDDKEDYLAMFAPEITPAVPPVLATEETDVSAESAASDLVPVSAVAK